MIRDVTFDERISKRKKTMASWELFFNHIKGRNCCSLCDSFWDVLTFIAEDYEIIQILSKKKKTNNKK